MARAVTPPGHRPSTLYVSTSNRPRHRVPGWQPAALTVLAGSAAVIASAGNLHSTHISARLLCTGGTIAFIILSTAAVLRAAAWLRHRTADTVGDTHASLLRILAVVAGVATTILIALALLAVPVGKLLLGGTLLGALLGIAGQQTLANLIAGVVLLFTRTITVGDRIRLHSGTLGGTFEGTVTEIGLIHLQLHTTEVPLAIPNTQVLGAAIAVLDPHTALPVTRLAPWTRRSVRRKDRHHHTTDTAA